jgi:hypothetical protein
MGAAALTDERIAQLLAMRKHVAGPMRFKPKHKGDHLEQDWSLTGEDGSRFLLYARQSTKLADGFSCGLSWEAPDGTHVPLARYNGPYHQHPNAIERTVIPFGSCHIHRATARYIQQGLKPDGFAEATASYRSLPEAFECILRDGAIEGASLDLVMIQQVLPCSP